MVAVVTLALYGTLSQTTERDSKVAARSPIVGTGPAPTPRPREPTPPPLRVAGHPAPATPAEAHLRAAMSAALHPAGPDSGALVYDLGAHAELYGRRVGIGRPPASVEKLWTTTAVLLKLGPNARLHTSILGRGKLRHGVWHGNLYLRGGGDPTFGDPTFNHALLQGHGPTANQLVAQLRHRGIRRVTGWVYGDESLFDHRRGGLITDYAADLPDLEGQLSALTYDHGSTAPHYNPATFAARELVLTMRDAQMEAKASPHDGTAPPGAQLLATVSSPPMSVMTKLMDVPSDDLFAELFAKQLGVRFGRGGTISAGARVIAHTISSSYGLHPKILDGSGLARADRTSPVQIVDLLRELSGTPVGRELVDSLPVVGRTGTVQSIAVKTPAAGHCVAKTGTLDDVTNLAGYCHSHGHHPTAFGLFIVGPDNVTALVLEGRMIAAIARY